MVAISLYRGNLHRVADVPRRWVAPKPQISLKNFKSLLSRRSKALSRLTSDSSLNPNPNPNPNSLQEEQPQALDESFYLQIKPDSDNLDDGDSKLDVVLNPDDCVDHDQKLIPNPNSEIVKTELSDEKLKRKQEVEEKLKVSNDKKHGLVQLLKQVLTAEEELKRKIAIRPPLPIQVDSVSVTRNLTPWNGSDPNLIGDRDPGGGEADALVNQNLHSRQIFRMNSTSPSSESPLRKPPCVQQHTAGRTSLGDVGQQGHVANLPTVSISGTNYIASSPSPAASGGTSAFRDSRLPSPWN